MSKMTKQGEVRLLLTQEQASGLARLLRHLAATFAGEEPEVVTEADWLAVAPLQAQLER